MGACGGLLLGWDNGVIGGVTTMVSCSPCAALAQCISRATADTKVLCRAISSSSALPGSRAVNSCACFPLLLLLLLLPSVAIKLS